MTAYYVEVGLKSFVHNGTDLVLSIDEKQDIVFHLMYDDGLIKSMKYTVERQRGEGQIANRAWP